MALRLGGTAAKCLVWSLPYLPCSEATSQMGKEHSGSSVAQLDNMSSGFLLSRSFKEQGVEYGGTHL